MEGCSLRVCIAEWCSIVQCSATYCNVVQCVAACVTNRERYLRLCATARLCVCARVRLHVRVSARARLSTYLGVQLCVGIAVPCGLAIEPQGTSNTISSAVVQPPNSLLLTTPKLPLSDSPAGYTLMPFVEQMRPNDDLAVF